MVTKIKSKLLTKWFTEWVAEEFDVETLQLTQGLIEQRVTVLKTAIDTANRKEIIGFRRL
jgi:hypothetical protein